MKERVINNKKGQLTLFIFMAIVIVLVIIGYNFLSLDSFVGSVDSQVVVVYDSVEHCFSDVTAQSLLDIGLSGGYYDLPENVNLLYFPYYFLDGENVMPSLSEIEGELEKYVGDLSFICIQKGLADLPDFDVTTGHMDVNVEIAHDDTVTFEISYPFTASKGENSYFVNEAYTYSYDVRLYTIHNYVSDIIREHDIEPRALCVNCAGDKAYENNLFIDLWPMNPNEIIFYISDEESIVNGEEFVYHFVIKYPENNNYDPFEDL